MQEKMVTEAQKELNLYLENHAAELSQISDQIIKICDPIEKSFSDSWVGYHANLYFKSFETPSIEEMFDSEWGGVNGYDEGWKTQTLDQIWMYIRKKSKIKFDLDEANEKLLKIQELSDDLKTQIEVATAEDSTVHIKAKAIRTNYSISSYIKAVGPKGLMTRDSKAAQQGMKVPPHIQAQGFANAIHKNIDSANKLIKLAGIAVSQKNSTETKSGNSWNYVNPIWMVYKLGILSWRLVKGNKVISSVMSVAIVILTLLAIDYTLAWSNTTTMFNSLRDLFTFK